MPGPAPTVVHHGAQRLPEAFDFQEALGLPQLDQAALWLALAALLLSLAFGAWLMHRLRVRRDQRVARERNERGRAGEARAAELLLEAGYEIIARQQRASYALRVGSAERRVGLSFDFVVAKDGQQCVAEVKTGRLVTQLKHADTRRQLLEYQLASGAAQVLLVDPDRAEITALAFPVRRAPAALNDPDAAARPGDSDAAATTANDTSEPSGSGWALALCLVLACALGAYLLVKQP